MPKECCIETWGKVADDEPVFIIRGKDILAEQPIRNWIQGARIAGVGEDKIARAESHLADILEFQRDHPDRCKIPD